MGEIGATKTYCNVRNLFACSLKKDQVTRLRLGHIHRVTDQPLLPGTARQSVTGDFAVKRIRKARAINAITITTAFAIGRANPAGGGIAPDGGRLRNNQGGAVGDCGAVGRLTGRPIRQTGGGIHLRELATGTQQAESDGQDCGTDERCFHDQNQRRKITAGGIGPGPWGADA